MRLFRRRPALPAPLDEKPYLVTLHAPGDQHHTFRMGPGDGVGLGTIRIDVDAAGVIHAQPIVDTNIVELADAVRKQLIRNAQRSGKRT